MKTIIGFLGGLIFTMAICCGDGYNPSNPNNIYKIDADQANFSKYEGKTIQHIQYLESAHTVPGCDDLVITFTDGTRMRMFINKYTLEIEQ